MCGGGTLLGTGCRGAGGLRCGKAPERAEGRPVVQCSAVRVGGLLAQGWAIARPRCVGGSLRNTHHRHSCTCLVPLMPKVVAHKVARLGHDITDGNVFIISFFFA